MIVFRNNVSDTRPYRIVDRGDLSWRRNSTQYDTRLFALVITTKSYVFRGEVNSRLIYRFTALDTCVRYACNDREQRASRLDGKRETSLWPLELRSLNLIVVVCTCERARLRACVQPRHSYYTSKSTCRSTRNYDLFSRWHLCVFMQSL